MQDINPKFDVKKKNVKQFYSADVIGDKRFSYNEGGWPLSEIAKINRATSLQEKSYLLSQLNDYNPSTNPNAGLSDAEIMLSHRSKYCQSPSEKIGWIETQIANRDARLAQQADAQQVKDGNIHFDNNDSGTKDE